jgi:Protease inhibitor Inh
MTMAAPHDSVRRRLSRRGCAMSLRLAFGLALIASVVEFAVGTPARAQVPSEAAKAMVGAWEISNAARDKTCPVTFTIDPGPGGFKLTFDADCGKVFPSLHDITVWMIAPNDALRLLDSKGAVILDFSEVESRMYEAERKGEGLYFLRTQAAIKAETVTPDQVVGDWALLREMEKPLCKLTLSTATPDGQGFKLTMKPGCDDTIAGLGFSTWRIESNELVLAGPGGSWRFAESDTATWERIPPSVDSMVLIRQ